jgi:hypothetical protein
MVYQIVSLETVRLPLQRPRRAKHFVDRVEEVAALVRDLQPGQVATSASGAATLSVVKKSIIEVVSTSPAGRWGR